VSEEGAVFTSLGTYTIIPNGFLDIFAPAAGHLKAMVYIQGRKYAYGTKNSITVSYRTLARECGCCEKSVRDAWQYWEEVGLVKIEHRKADNGQNLTNKITFLDDKFALVSKGVPELSSGGVGELSSGGRGTEVRGYRNSVPGNKYNLNNYKENNSILLRKTQKRATKKNELTRLVSLYGQQPRIRPDPSSKVFAFIGKLVKEYGAEHVERCIKQLGYQTALRDIDRPLVYLKGICEQEAKRKREAETKQNFNPLAEKMKMLEESDADPVQ